VRSPINEREILLAESPDEFKKFAIVCDSESIERAKTDAEDYYYSSITLGQGDLVYIRSRVKEFVGKNAQWYGDDGKLVTSKNGQTLLPLRAMINEETSKCPNRSDGIMLKKLTFSQCEMDEDLDVYDKL